MSSKSEGPRRQSPVSGERGASVPCLVSEGS
jgi:hypothetical protein